MEVKAGYKQTEVGVIPEDWQAGFIGDSNPFVTSGSRGWADFYSEEGFFFIRISNLSRESIYLDLANSRFVRLPADQSEVARTQVRTGDVLISITADIGIVGHVDGRVPTPAFINQHIAIVRFDPKLADGKFVSYFLASENPQKLFRAATDTGAKAGMSLATVKKIGIAHPPLSEQRAIAAALSDVDALLDGLTRLIAKKRDLKQAAMQQLLTGQTRLPGFSGEWEVKRLGEVVDTDPENLGSDCRTDFTFSYISLEDVDRGSLLSNSEQSFGTAPSRARRVLRRGDVLVSTVRPNLQSHLLFGGGNGVWICSTGFSVIRCRPGVTHPGFIFAQLFGSAVKRQIEALLAGSNYPAINGGDVAALEMPMPAYSEQSAIATVLSDMDAELEALEARREKTRALKQAMMQELLTGKTRLVVPASIAAAGV